MRHTTRMITALALVATMGCDRSAKEPPPSGGTATAEPGCTLDTLVPEDQKVLAEIRKDNTQYKARAATRRGSVLEVLKSAGQISLPTPTELKALAGAGVPFARTAQRKFEAKLNDTGQCRLKQEWTNLDDKPTVLSWTQLATLAAHNFGQLDYDSRTDRQRRFFYGNFADQLPRGGRNQLRKALDPVLQDEEQLKLLMSWALRVLPVLIATHGLDQKEMKAWVKDYYKASKTNMASLAAAAEKDSELVAFRKVREGQIMRRWLGIRSSEKTEAHADEMILVYRFWLIQIAKQLDMSTYVRRWSKKTAKKLKKAKTLAHRDWYLEQL